MWALRVPVAYWEKVTPGQCWCRHLLHALHNNTALDDKNDCIYNQEVALFCPFCLHIPIYWQKYVFSSSFSWLVFLYFDCRVESDRLSSGTITLYSVNPVPCTNNIHSLDTKPPQWLEIHWKDNFLAFPSLAHRIVKTMYYRRMCRIQPAVIFDVVLYLILYLYDSNMIQSLHYTRCYSGPGQTKKSENSLSMKVMLLIKAVSPPPLLSLSVSTVNCQAWEQCMRVWCGGSLRSLS